ncbi:MAG: small metal-binding protein SmbP [Gammaproteobacteria bacterium]
MKRKTLVLIASSLGLLGGVGCSSEATHTAQALEHAQAAVKESTIQGIQEHAQVSLTHVQAAEQAKEAGAEHLTAAETALNNALKAQDAGSAKMAVEGAESHLKMIQ